MVIVTAAIAADTVGSPPLQWLIADLDTAATSMRRFGVEAPGLWAIARQFPLSHRQFL